MCNTVTIAGILTAWPVGEMTMEEMRGVRERPRMDTRTPTKGPTSTNTIPVPTMITREVERAHVGMRTKKTTGAINSIPARNLPGDAIHRVPPRAGVLDFGMVYEKFSRPIHSYVYRLLGSQEDADDLTQ